MSTEELVQYSTLKSDMSTYAEIRILEFIIGSADIDAAFDGFVSELENMGLQEMIELKQDAYD